MLVQILDQLSLSSLAIVNVRSYLNSRGWNDQGRWGNRPANIYASEIGGRAWEVILPWSDRLADYAENMAGLIAVLEQVEERSQFNILQDLQAIGTDIIRVRSPHEPVQRYLSLNRSAELLSDSYSMLSSAARAVENPQPAYRGKLTADVSTYLDNVRPAPGYHESYNLTLHSPVRATVGQQEDFGEDFYSPFPRRATMKLAQALQSTDRAISESIVGDSLDPFEKAIADGVSANLCDSVADLAKNGHGITVDVIWSDIRPSNTPAAHFSFSENSADILVEVARAFRRNEPSVNEQIIAQVVQLEREPDEFDGQAIILAARDGRLTRIRVQFYEAVYNTVIDAFREHRAIMLNGDIHRVGNGYVLRNPGNLTLAAQESH